VPPETHLAMTDFTTRIATLADERSVCAVLDASYSILMAPDYDPETLALALPLMCKANSTLLRSTTYYVAVTAEGDIIGCGGWTQERPGNGAIEPGLGHIRHFATHPDWTRCGVGRALMNVCDKTARTHGTTRFECYSSLSAKNFYTALGFSTRGPIDITLTPGCIFPSILMDRTL